MHLLDESAEEAEIEVRGGAEGRTVSGAMHVRNVRADGEMDGHGDLMLVGSYEDAGIRVFDFDDPAIKELPGGFAVADADAMRKFGEFVDELAADAPEDGFALFACAVNGAEKMAKIFGGEKVWK